MNSNRNSWSKEESTILLQNIKSHGVNEGARKSASQLGRTTSACFNKWERCRKENSKDLELLFLNLPTSKSSNLKPILQDNMTVTYHNGVTKPMQIIAKTPTLIVAKADDVVVTIQL